MGTSELYSRAYELDMDIAYLKDTAVGYQRQGSLGNTYCFLGLAKCLCNTGVCGSWGTIWTNHSMQKGQLSSWLQSKYSFHRQWHELRQALPCLRLAESFSPNDGTILFRYADSKLTAMAIPLLQKALARRRIPCICTGLSGQNKRCTPGWYPLLLNTGKGFAEFYILLLYSMALRLRQLFRLQRQDITGGLLHRSISCLLLQSGLVSHALEETSPARRLRTWVRLPICSQCWS